MTCLYFEIPMARLARARHVMASSQEEDDEGFTPLTGINLQCGNIFDFRERMSQ